MQVAASSPQFSTLVSLLKRAGLVGALKKGNYTVFAPSNAAFAKLPKSTLEAVGQDKALLKTVLTYHVVKGKVPDEGRDVERQARADARRSERQVRVRGGTVYLNGSSRVTKADVMASNGVIHVIDRVLIPKT